MSDQRTITYCVVAGDLAEELHEPLRRHWREAGLVEGFQILDSDDQQRLIKRVIAGMGLDEARFPPRQATRACTSRSIGPATFSWVRSSAYFTARASPTTRGPTRTTESIDSFLAHAAPRA